MGVTDWFKNKFGSNSDPTEEPSIIEEAGLPSNFQVIDRPPIVPGQGTPPPPGHIQNSSGPLPPNFGYQPALVDTVYPRSAGPIGLLPVQVGAAATNAGIAATAKKIAQNVVAGIVIPTTTPTSDGLTHGRSVWDGDAAVIQLTDEFTNVLSGTFNTSAVGPTGIGQLGWSLIGTVANSSMLGGTFPNIGSVAWLNSGSLSTAAGLLLNTAGQGSASLHAVNGWALGETPGWWMTWVFKLDNIGAVTGGQNFNTTKKSIYIGLVGMSSQGSLTLPTSRPDVFLGLRYDTSVTPGTLVLSAAANHSGATTVYSGTITGGANNAYAGMSFVVTGFSTSANNGTFTCTASAAGTLTLNNGAGVSESKTASAAGPAGLGDSFFTFEAVANQTFSAASRKNIQGTTQVTTVSPTQGVWHRLDMISSTPGFVTMILDGSSTNTFTVAIPTITLTITTLAGSVTLGEANAIWSPSATIPENPFSAGSSVTISGYSGASAGFNGTWILNGSTSGNLSWPLATVVTSGNASPGTVVGFPSLTPSVWLGSDDTSSGAANLVMAVDYFSFVWNPNLGPNAPGTPDPTKARYW